VQHTDGYADLNKFRPLQRSHLRQNHGGVTPEADAQAEMGIARFCYCGTVNERYTLFAL
jgi:hypothetical protein